jgi:RHS repeat-associated protein
MRSGVIRRYSYDLHGWLTRSTIQVPIYVTKNTISSSKAASYYKALPQSTEQGQLFPITPTIQDAVITFTDSLLYTNGAYPRYNGVVSSRIHTNGGRYNYRYDDFDRLESAEYIASSNADSAEDFSTDYSYDAMGNITRILRQGIIDYDGATEEFGVLDALELTYDGNHVESVYQQGEGKMYYGRTGYGVGNEATEEEYKWSKAGNLYSDTSRSIAGISYNRNAQPLSITKSNGSSVAYSYSSDGECLSATSTVVLTIGKVKRKLTGVRRRYVEDFVFENDTLKYSYFAGGYFDENGAVRYIHKDHQGSTIMVTDSVDGICQQIGYYPYGEPWREPTGQPRLFSGKEREKMMSLRDYDFTARRYNSAICQWTTPDQYASKFAYTSPTVYCASNPIKFVDPDGKEITLSKGLKLFSKIVVMVNLQMLTNDILSLKKDNNGLEKVCIVKTFDGGKEYGTKLIRDLISSPRRVEIDYRNSKKINVKGCDKDTNYAYPTKKYRSGGSDVRINFSNKIDITVLTFDTKNQTTQWERRPAFIGMAHELIHAIHMMDGKYYMSKKDSGYSADEFNVEEENSTIGLYFSNGYPTENDIRAEHQLHNRIAYLYE